MTGLRLALLAAAIAVAAQWISALAQPVRDPLLPGEVLEASLERFPQILEGLARLRAAEGTTLAAEGAFDLVFDADARSRVTGFWDGSYVKTEARQAFRNHGATLYGGYRLSDGNFPVYEDVNFTNTGGEFKIGAIFALLRDRTIDPRRFGVTDARLGERQAELDVLLTKVGVQQQALAAYWRWVATGQELDVYRSLLAIAEEREAGLEEQVRKGALAGIAVVENRQNITRRRILVAEAELSHEVAANVLSFYYRNAAGEPQRPDPARLPSNDELDPLRPSDAFEPAAFDDVLATRPELRRLRLAVDRARQEVRLGENALRPRLDLNLEVSRDIGAIAEGGASRDSTDTIVGLRFSVPLQQREARGQLQSAEAKLRETRLMEQRIEDQISIELRNILATLAASLQLAALAETDVEQSLTMVDAERTRFASGASDFFLVNVREETAANSRIRLIQANLKGYLAKTDYDAATLNAGALGL